MYTYTVDRMRNPEFFSVARSDALTGKTIVSGDTVCICASCNAIHLENSWIANDRHCVECNSARFISLNDSFMRTLRVNSTVVERRVNTSFPPRRHINIDAAAPVNYNNNQSAFPPRRTPIEITVRAYPEHSSLRKRGGRILLWILGVAVGSVLFAFLLNYLGI